MSKDILLKLEEHNLTQYLNLKGYVPHDEAIKHQRTSQVLLMVEIDSEDTKCIIPGKLFEYMVSGRPIIALGPKGSDVEQLLNETNTGRYFSYTDYKRLRETILEHFESFRHNDLKSKPVGLQQYSRKALTKKLATLILK